MIFLFPVLSLMCAGIGIANRSPLATVFGAVIYLPWTIYGGPLCGAAQVILLFLPMATSERVQWLAFAAAVALTLARLYTLLPTPS